MLASTRTDMLFPFRRGDGLVRGLGEPFGGDEFQAGFTQDLSPLLHVGALEADDDGDAGGGGAAGGDDALGEHVTAEDAAEDIDKDNPDAGITLQELEGGGDHLFRGTATDIEEVGGAPAGGLQEIHRGHGEPGPVDHAADIAVEADVVQVVLGGSQIPRILLGGVAQGLNLLVTEEGVVVEIQFGVEGYHIAALGDGERVDLNLGTVFFEEEAVHGVDQATGGAQAGGGKAEEDAGFAGLVGLEPQAGMDLFAENGGRIFFGDGLLMFRLSRVIYA